MREVEVFQWDESCETIEQRRGNQVKRGKKYSYKAVWSKSFRDSNGYADPNYRVNIRPSVSNETFKAHSCMLGEEKVPVD